MSKYFIRQPNGLYCRFCSGSGLVVRTNLSENYIYEAVKKAREVAWGLVDDQDWEALEANKKAKESFYTYLQEDVATAIESANRKSVYDALLLVPDISNIKELFLEIGAPAGAYEKFLGERKEMLDEN